MKKCPKCGNILEVNCFRKDKNGKDGLDGWCKDCRSKNVNRELAIQRRKRFYADKKAEYHRKYREEHWKKVRARELAKYHYKERMKCSVIGCNQIAERHHHDYDKPLDIIWLCKKHHCILRRS